MVSLTAFFIVAATFPYDSLQERFIQKWIATTDIQPYNTYISSDDQALHEVIYDLYFHFL